MSLLVYNLLLVIFSPLLLAYYAWRIAKGKEDPDSDLRAERWGKLPHTLAENRGSPRFWVHAVSVGEVMAAIPVLRELRARYPDALIVVSAITPGGREAALGKVPPADEVIYFPLDFPFAVRRALAAVRPEVILLMEWEIWPNFLVEAERQGAKIAVLNGRVSDRGLRRGKRATFFTRPGLAVVDLFAMQSEEDARRAALVGADPAKVVTLGNTKFDESVTPLTPAERAALRADLSIPPNVPVWVCGSTRPGEEEIIAAAFVKARRSLPELRLVVAPRHLERANEVAAVLRGAGLEVARRSEQRKEAPPAPNNGGANTLVSEGRAGDPSPEAAAVTGTVAPPLLGAGGALLLDTFGELARVYAVAEVAFIGGSLLPYGGQSVFQPLAQGVPAVFGPHMNNQRDIAALSKAVGVGFEVRDAETLAAEVVRLVAVTEAERTEIAAAARGLIERNQGVASRCVEAVAGLLEGRG